MAQPIPPPRGEISEALIDVLGSSPGSPAPIPGSGADDPVTDEDLQLALYLCYELHYGGVESADSGCASPNTFSATGRRGVRRSSSR